MDLVDGIVWSRTNGTSGGASTAGPGALLTEQSYPAERDGELSCSGHGLGVGGKVT